MVWLKKEILFILSGVFLIFTSCDNDHNKLEATQEDKNSQEDLIEDLFTQIQNWNDLSAPLIDSLGFQISDMDSSLTFLPYSNEYERESLIFFAQHKNALQIFEESPFLNQSNVSQQSSYKVWRKKLNELKILDISIEPHPTLNWLFVIRLRAQE